LIRVARCGTAARACGHACAGVRGWSGVRAAQYAQLLRTIFDFFTAVHG
jgi:hypothetical protein